MGWPDLGKKFALTVIDDIIRYLGNEALEKMCSDGLIKSLA